MLALCVVSRNQGLAFRMRLVCVAVRLGSAAADVLSVMGSGAIDVDRCPVATVENVELQLGLCPTPTPPRISWLREVNFRDLARRMHCDAEVGLVRPVGATRNIVQPRC